MTSATRSEPLLLQAPVRRVTLLEDRAQVTRVATLPELPPGDHRLVVHDVSPLVSDRTLLARGGAGLRVHDLRVTRDWRIGVEEQPAPLRDLPDRDELRRELHQAKDRHALNLRREQLIAAALSLQLEAVNRELPWVSDLPGDWGAALERLFAELQTLGGKALEESERIDELKAQLQRLDQRNAAVPLVTRVLRADLLLDLSLEAGGARELELQYVVPCALWRPIHRATLLGEEVRFECEGAAWQATGEDWRDVALSFSTARSTQRSEPPLLSDDWLSARPKTEKTVSVAVREEAIQTTGEGAPASRATEGLPGVDDGGEVRLLRAAAPITLVSDGRMVRVPISSFSTAAEVDRVCRPERAPLVHLRSRQPNQAPHPLLAGPVDLLRGSGYVGRGEVEFVSAGERFALGWGSEDGVRVRREQEEERERARLTGKQTITRKVTLYLSNLDDRPVRFALEERVPVSEISKVQVEVDPKETQPTAGADGQGIVRWQLELPAHGTREVKLVYRLIASSDVEGL